MRTLSVLAAVLLVSLAASCGSGGPLPDAPRPPAPSPSPPLSAPAVVAPLPSPDALIEPASSPADAGTDAGGPGACPAGMALVDTMYCPKVRLRCLRDEYNKPNHITICHAFAPGQVCLTEPRRQRFCIDKYEYPNREGAHPPVMVDWYDGASACGALGKRLCWESEWVSACEGPDKLPFPYGTNRDPDRCNIDNPYVKPDLTKMYSPVREVSGAELLKLDQSVASGEMPGCMSGFGVHDMTGNFDEWVNAEENHEKSRWAGLKGGAWGHVRNACRPMTTSHPPEFTYYFISFRCCADAAPDPAVEGAIWAPPTTPKHRDPKGSTSAGWTTSERGPHRPGH